MVTSLAFFSALAVLLLLLAKLSLHNPAKPARVTSRVIWFTASFASLALSSFVLAMVIWSSLAARVERGVTRPVPHGVTPPPAGALADLDAARQKIESVAGGLPSAPPVPPFDDQARNLQSRSAKFSIVQAVASLRKQLEAEIRPESPVTAAETRAAADRLAADLKTVSDSAEPVRQALSSENDLKQLVSARAELEHAVSSVSSELDRLDEAGTLLGRLDSLFAASAGTVEEFESALAARHRAERLAQAAGASRPWLAAVASIVLIATFVAFSRQRRRKELSDRIGGFGPDRGFLILRAPSEPVPAPRFVLPGRAWALALIAAVPLALAIAAQGPLDRIISRSRPRAWPEQALTDARESRRFVQDVRVVSGSRDRLAAPWSADRARRTQIREALAAANQNLEAASKALGEAPALLAQADGRVSDLAAQRTVLVDAVPRLAAEEERAASALTEINARYAATFPNAKDMPRPRSRHSPGQLTTITKSYMPGLANRKWGVGLG